MFLLKAIILLAGICGLNAQLRVCYITNWAQYRPQGGSWFPAMTDPNLCTHIVIAFAKLTNGALAQYEWNDDRIYSETIALKNTNPSLKVLIAVGGWNMGSTDFSNMVSTDAGINNFVTTSIAYLQRYKFDGLDLDWEYPGIGAGSRPQDKQRFTVLCQRLKEAFIPYNFLLTAAVAAGRDNINTAYEIRNIANYLDILNVMTYDYHGAWDPRTGANAPLFSHPAQLDPDFSIEYTINKYINDGFPAAKITLGLGTYGRTFRLANSNNHVLGSAAVGPASAGTWTREAGFYSYYEICQKLSQGWTRGWDQITRTPYAYSGNELVSYDDEESLTEKVAYIKSKKLGGAMFWALDLDDFDGAFCGKGKYPLSNFVKALLGNTNPPTVGPTRAQTTLSGQVTTTTTKSPGGEFTCRSQDGLFPHPTNCNQYYICNHGNPTLMSCPGNLYFNPLLLICDWPSNVHNCPK